MTLPNIWSPAPQSVASADVDGDGDIDLLSASQNDDKIAWYENNGSGGFSPHIVTTNTNGASAVSSADIDGDGDIDLLSASVFDDKVAWYENNGSGGFSQHVIPNTGDSPRSIASADVDTDGDMDVLVGWAGDDKVGWYENDGAGNFIEHIIATNADLVQSVSSADIDSDGDIDLLSASRRDIVWYENNGSEVFTGHVLSDTTFFASSISSADVDGDGDLDLLTASRNDPIAWFEQRANPVLTSPATVTTLQNTTGVVTLTATDQDGDTLIFGLTGGADQALFTLDATGQISFQSGQDFNNPNDANGDNRYEVEITVTDDEGGSVTQLIQVNVVKNLQTAIFECPDLARAGKSITCQISYNTSDDNAATTGLGLKLHYDSSKLGTPVIGSILQTNLLQQNNQPQADDNNLDGVSNTDRFINISWADSGVSWPGGALPTDLYEVELTLNADAAAGATTSLNFSAQPAIGLGYGFSYEPYNLTIAPDFSWDIDGDGSTRFTTDGILIMRYLFSFRGDQLIAGAVGDDATRTTAEEITQYLDDHIEILDTDLDGVARPLTDGLLVVRYLAELSGETLVNGAVGSDGTRTTAAAIEGYLAVFRD